MKKPEIAVMGGSFGVVANCDQFIAQRIYSIRGMQVMLDRDLAELYGVETKRLNEQVRRNSERFPDGFMFQLTDVEFAEWKSQIATSNLKSQIATSNSFKMGLRHRPLSDHRQHRAAQPRFVDQLPRSPRDHLHDPRPKGNRQSVGRDLKRGMICE